MKSTRSKKNVKKRTSDENDSPLLSGFHSKPEILRHAAPDIVGDTLHIDVSKLPIKYVDRISRTSTVTRIISGGFMVFLGTLLMHLNSTMVKSEKFAGLIEEGAKSGDKAGLGLVAIFLAALLIALGMIVIIYYLVEWFHCKTIRINKKFINVSERGLKKSRMFLEPLRNYEGVKSRTRTEERNGILFKQCIIELVHKKDDVKNVPLYVDNATYTNETLLKKTAEHLGVSIVE